jgi:hypothetical protein
MAIWCILSSFGKFSPRFGVLYQEKSGNPAFFRFKCRASTPRKKSLKKWTHFLRSVYKKYKKTSSLKRWKCSHVPTQ